MPEGRQMAQYLAHCLKILEQYLLTECLSLQCEEHIPAPFTPPFLGWR